MTDARQATPEDLTIVTTKNDLESVVARALKAPLIAVDAEGNGLFAYRAALCTVQLAWQEGERTAIAVVDTLAVDPAPLGALLSRAGPLKVLHDFTFDVKLLAEAGVELDNVHDTSVLARMLGRKATGLASLLSADLGIVVAKELQQHDWSRRPLQPAELAYLAADVRHLAALYQKLLLEARAADIEAEVLDETLFKRESALAPPREKRPAYLRIKGADALDARGLAVVRRLVLEREVIAEEWDVPPFKVVANETLLAIAERKPTTMDDLRRIKRGISPRLASSSKRLLDAVRAGIEDGEVPADERAVEARLDRALVAARRAREKRFTTWRRAEAASRGVDEQVVLPGHCLSDLVGIDPPDAAAIAAIRGMGEKRFARYGATLLALLERDVPLPVAPASAATGAAGENAAIGAIPRSTVSDNSALADPAAESDP
jgi:ribonuclease D